MASFEERIYELGTEALAEQERQVVETRGRGTAIIAAAAVIASLLAKPVFHGRHPHGFFEVATVAAGLLGCAGVLLFVVLLLRPRELGFSVKAGATYRSPVGARDHRAADRGYRARRSFRGAPRGEPADR